jgi:hypothetical protein
LKLFLDQLPSNADLPLLSPAMAFRLASTTASSSSNPNPTPSTAAPGSSSSSCASSASDDEDDNFEDWQDDTPSGPVYSLFGGKDKEFKSVNEASEWDREQAGVDFDKEVERLGESGFSSLVA